MRIISLLTIIVALATVTTGCIHPEVTLRKSKLLDPMMDPAKTSSLASGMATSEPYAGVEKGASALGGALGASCPSCGG